jgi:D-alanine-D-alanine ligase
MGEQKAVLGVLVEVKAVHEALTKLGHEVQRVPLSPPLEDVREALRRLETDVVFNLFEGFAGRPETESAVAEMLSELGLAYTGCSPAALSLALDKARSKAIMEANGLATPRFQVLTPQTLSHFNLDYPCIVKPAAEDASHGLSEESVVGDFAGLEKQVTRITELYQGRALVEEYIDGREFNATVLGNEDPLVLPVTEIVYTLPDGMPRILTFAAKWESKSLYFKSSLPVCPAAIDGDARQRIAAAALGAFKLLGCRGYARVDFRMDAHGVPQIIEVNPNPDLSPGYGAALQARRAGMSYHRLIERIVQLALERRPVGTPD